MLGLLTAVAVWVFGIFVACSLCSIGIAAREGAAMNWPGPLDLLQGLANAKEFPEQPFAQYYLGIAWRGLGIQELVIADAKPPEPVWT